MKNSSTERVLQILTQDNDEGQRLRQSDPFLGILTEAERTWFLEEYEESAPSFATNWFVQKSSRAVSTTCPPPQAASVQCWRT
jgi:hypothetical protein